MIETPEVFNAEQLVVVTSNFDIASMEWMDYMEENWEKLIRKKSRMLLLAGIHGNPDGTIGRVDQELVDDYREKVDGLREDFAQDIADKEVTIDILDLGKFVATEADGGGSADAIDSPGLTQAVKERQPTLIVIAFCWTRQSVLNRIFRAAGIYAFLVLNDDRARITEGRCLAMGEEQRRLVERVAEENPRNLFLHGGTGTGKTLLLAQALDIKKSYYELELGKRVEVTVCVYNDDASRLMEEMRTRHFGHVDRDQISFSFLRDLFLKECVKGDTKQEAAWWKEHGYEDISYTRTTAELKAVLNSFSRRRRTDPPDLHRILVVDEVDRLTRYWPPDEGGDSMDWRNMVPGDDGGDGGGGLDVLLALSPFPRGNDSAEVPPTCPITVPASTEDVLVWELTACYRNNPNIQRLNQFVTTHFQSASERKPEVILPPERLPSGPVPTWIVRSATGASDAQVMDLVEAEFAAGGEETCVVSSFGLASHPALEEWCRRKERGGRWSLCRNSLEMTGCEAQLLVKFIPKKHRGSNVFELLNRARNKLVIVTTRQQSSGVPDPEVVASLEEAHDHGREGHLCDKGTRGRCPFVGVELVRRRMVGDQSPWYSSQKRARCIEALSADLGLSPGRGGDFHANMACVESVAEAVTRYINAKSEGASAERELSWLEPVLTEVCRAWEEAVKDGRSGFCFDTEVRRAKKCLFDKFF